MMYFWECGQSNIKELSSKLLLDPSTLTPLLKNLEKKLGILEKTNGLKEKIDKIKKLIGEMPDVSSNLQTKEKIEEIKEILNKIQF